MLVHEFIAIKRNEIPKDISYDIKTNRHCIKVSDDVILDNYKDFLSLFKAHWCFLGNEHQGLDYHGITIILNEDLIQFISILSKYKKREDIKNLLEFCHKAVENNEDIIHLGV